MIRFDDSQIKRFQNDLKRFSKVAIPIATRSTLNTAAFHAQGLARKQVDKNFILRNKFTQKSILHHKSKTLRISRQSSAVGSTQEYMERQELGGTEFKSSKEGLPIATGYSVGQEGARRRTKIPMGVNRLRNIKLSRARKRPLGQPKNDKQARLFAVQDAVITGKRYVYMEFRKWKGIVKVIGGKKDFKRGWPKGAKLKTVYDLSNTTITTRADPWLQPTVASTTKLIPQFYVDALRFQIKRRDTFKGRL